MSASLFPCTYRDCKICVFDRVRCAHSRVPYSLAPKMCIIFVTTYVRKSARFLPFTAVGARHAGRRAPETGRAHRYRESGTGAGPAAGTGPVGVFMPA